MSSSMMVHPSDQMSDAVVAPSSWIISGAIQYGVPTTSCLILKRANSARKKDKKQQHLLELFL